MQKRIGKYLSAGIVCLEKKLFKRQIEFILLLLFSVQFISCEAPRSNPLDPMNSVNSGLGTLEGTVQTHSIPYTPIKDVLVYWVPGGRIVNTDASGKFVINNIEPVNGRLIVEKQGYSTDTLSINWAGLKKVTKQISLTRAPEIDSTSIFTVVENQNSSITNSYIVIVLKINDSDNILGSVMVENPELDVKKTLRYTFAETNTYLDTLTLTELKLPDIERIIGTKFNFIGKDKNTGKWYLLGTEKITRVIKEQVSIVSPDNEVVSNMPQLTWQSINAGYIFTFMIEIYTSDAISPVLVKRVTNINSSAVSYRVTDTLQQRDYYWVVWILDKFGNRARSRPAEFSVQ